MSNHQGNNVFVEFHALASYAPSNLNRDDLGAPKTAVFGGVRRLRISSQCQKRSWRKSELFKRELAVERERFGERTKQIGQAVIDHIEDPKLSDEEVRGLNAIVASFGGESSTEYKEVRSNTAGLADGAGEHEAEDDEEADESTKTTHLLYLSLDEQTAVAAFIVKEREAIKNIGALLCAADTAGATARVEAEVAVAKAPAAQVVEAIATPPIGAAAGKAADKAAKDAKKAADKAARDAKKAADKAAKDAATAAGKAGREEAQKMLDALRKKLAKHMLEYVPRSAVDVGLFGRFLTKTEFREIDAAMQVAHALGTQKADVEYDYFTAIDDRTNKCEHIGEAELSASVFYKYAACDMALLRENLGPSNKETERAAKEQDADVQTKIQAHKANARAIAARAMKAIAHAMARVVPTGKKNSTAPQSPADYLEVVVREDAPVSLVNAFLDPVRAEREHDVMHVSIARLQEHASTYDAMYGADAVHGRLVLSSRVRPKDPPPPTGALAKGEKRVVASLVDLGAALEATLLAVLPP